MGYVTIVSSYLDALAGIDAGSFSARLDGSDISDLFEVTTHSATANLTAQDGTHVLELSIKDRAGNRASVTRSFCVNTTAPLLTVSPADGETLSENTPVLLATYADPSPGCDLDTGSLFIELDGVEITGSFSIDSAQARFAIPSESPLSDQEHSLLVRISDQAGNETEVRSSFTVVTVRQVTVSLTASPMDVIVGSSTILSWDSRDASRAFIDNGVGEVAVAGSLAISPSQSTEYTITAVGELGTSSVSVFVRVLGSPFPPPEGTWGSRYADLIPADAIVDSYDADRFAVITGLIHDMAGNPLEGVLVRIHGHHEYGSSFTNSAGRYAIPVEGGQSMTIHAERNGLIDVQRSKQVPWNEVVLFDTCEMIPHDQRITAVVLDGDPDATVVHHGTPITDQSGERTVSVVITGDTKAIAVDAQGNDITSVSAFSLRATEYPTAASMPARLPPTSAFTHCVELTVDGVKRVRFTKPVVVWIDNFLALDTTADTSERMISSRGSL